MSDKKKPLIGLFWIMLFYQLVFLLLIIVSVNAGMFFFLEKEVIAITAEELEKRNSLLQLTLEENFMTDYSLPPHLAAPENNSQPPPPPALNNLHNLLPSPESPERREITDEQMISHMKEGRIRTASEITLTRYTVITPEGDVRFDSALDPAGMGNIKDRREIANLLREDAPQSTVAVREDAHTGKKNIYQALPLYQEGELIGITRVSQPFEVTEELHRRIMADIRLSLAIALILIIIILIPVIKYQIRLVGLVEQTALNIANGNFENRRPRTFTREFSSLADSMEHMARELKSQIGTIEKQNRKLKEQSLIDELTGLGNRRYFNQKQEYAWWLCQRGKHPISFMILDIDRFKQYNDSLGHPAGDECLKEVSLILKNAVHRHSDILARLGGEEFGVLLPENDGEQAMMLARKILEGINGAALPHPDSPVAPHVTMSIGLITLFPSQDQRMEDLMAKADEALYRAKETGRNRIVMGES